MKKCLLQRWILSSCVWCRAIGVTLTVVAMRGRLKAAMQQREEPFIRRLGCCAGGLNVREPRVILWMGGCWAAAFSCCRVALALWFRVLGPVAACSRRRRLGVWPFPAREGCGGKSTARAELTAVAGWLLRRGLGCGGVSG